MGCIARLSNSQNRAHVAVEARRRNPFICRNPYLEPTMPTVRTQFYLKPQIRGLTAFRAWLAPALLSVITAILSVPAAAQSVVADPAVPARVIVKFKSNSAVLMDRALVGNAFPANRALVLGQRLGLAMTAGQAVSEQTQVVFASGISSAELARRLSLESDVEYAVPDERRYHFAAPNDPLYPNGLGGNGPATGQWYLRAPSGAVQSSINIEPAWNITTGSPSVVVADLDTGVRFDHPDLMVVAAGGNLLPGYDMIADVGVANDGDGRDADASDPGDWLTQADISTRGGEFYQCDTAPENSSWHGTQTAGLIAAITNNGLGMASVGRNIRLLPVRVLGKCGGFDSDIIAGMRWAAGLAVPGVPANTNPARVLNMSLGAEGACPASYADAVTAVNAAGAVIVASAGNSTGHSVGAPANCVGVIAVAGLRHVGTKVGFSDLGPEIAIAAPGGNCVNTAAGSPCLYPILTTSNSGATTPVAPIYTDSFNPSLGTSFSAPLVSGTIALMLSAQPALTPFQIRLTLEATARPFPTTSSDNGTTVPQCTAPQFDAAGNAIDQLECVCTIDTCGAGMLDAGAAVAASGSLATTQVPVEGLWWNSPPGSESGWGINLAQQGSVLFATWFTYDLSGKAWWLSMTATPTGSNPDVYTGQLIQTHGPAFSAMPFDPAVVTRTPVGSGTLTFSDLDRGTFNYVVNGTQQTKAITRQVFGPLPTCVYQAQPDLATASNYQDLWWVAAGAESGWGVNLIHQGDNIFATWFTYDTDGTPMWLSVTAAKSSAGVYSGPLIRTTGPSFSAVPFNPALVTRSTVGSATFTFASGNAATFAYSVNGVSQSKQIVRQLFAPPAGTVCH
jgi:serine protease